MVKRVKRKRFPDIPEMSKSMRGQMTSEFSEKTMVGGTSVQHVGEKVSSVQPGVVQPQEGWSEVDYLTAYVMGHIGKNSVKKARRREAKRKQKPETSNTSEMSNSTVQSKIVRCYLGHEITGGRYECEAGHANFVSLTCQMCGFKTLDAPNIFLATRLLEFHEDEDECAMLGQMTSEQSETPAKDAQITSGRITGQQQTTQEADARSCSPLVEAASGYAALPGGSAEGGGHGLKSLQKVCPLTQHKGGAVPGDESSDEYCILPEFDKRSTGNETTSAEFSEKTMVEGMNVQQSMEGKMSSTQSKGSVQPCWGYLICLIPQGEQ